MTPKDTCKQSSVFVLPRKVQREWGGIPVRMIICMNTPLRHQIQQNKYYELEEAIEKLKRGVNIKKGLKKYIKEGERAPEIDYDV